MIARPTHVTCCARDCGGRGALPPGGCAASPRDISSRMKGGAGC
jgi:hypothetical protein